MRRTIARLLPLIAAGALLAVPAAASATPHFGPAHAKPTSGAPVYNINGYNWGGYAARGSGFTSVSATWVQPTATCNSRNDLYAPWVGLDGYGSSTVEQTGVATDCSSGSAVNEPWYEMYPASPVYLNTGTYKVSFGDTIHASVVYSSSRFTLTLSDTTKGWTYTTSKTLSSARRVSAEVIIESPTGSYPNFGTLRFSSATVNGNTLGSFGPVAMDPSSGGVYEAHASALSGGTAFTMTYEHE
jgi:hypothetical protein